MLMIDMLSKTKLFLLTKMHVHLLCNPFSFWLCFILAQTLSPGRTLCSAVICCHILHLMETSLFLLSLPPPAPLLLLAPARDPVWRSCRLVRQLPVRPPLS